MYISELKDSDKFIAVLMIGALYALEQDVISIEEAENLIFRPYNIFDVIQSKDLKKLISKGCEIDDINDLIPHLFRQEISSIKEDALSFIKTHPIIKYPNDIEIKKD